MCAKLVVDQYMKQLGKCFANITKTETDKYDRKLRYRKAHVKTHGGTAFIDTCIVFSAVRTTIKQ